MRRRGRDPSGRDRADAGFAAADGLIALTLTAMLLALVLNAASAGVKAGRAAWERRLAMADAEYRLATAWPGLNKEGQVSGPAWRVTAHTLLAADDGPSLCRVTADGAAPGSARTVRIETVRFCDARAPK